MKLEYLKRVNEHGDSIVRLFEFDSIQAESFKQAIQGTIIENRQQLDVAGLNFIQPLNCNLTLRIAETDKGISSPDGRIFFCDLTSKAYKAMLLSIEPFCENNNSGYQWLYDIDTTIEFLFSPSGDW